MELFSHGLRELRIFCGTDDGKTVTDRFKITEAQNNPPLLGFVFGFVNVYVFHTADNVMLERRAK